MIIDRHAQLKALHLHGMAAAWQEWQAEWTAQQQPVIPEVWLDRLIAAEQADRKARSLSYQLRTAKFPHHRDLIHFDWAESPLAKVRIEKLATAGFMAQANNLILVGGTGTGKTHLAIALGVSAIHLEKRVRFYNAVDLVNQLEKRNNLEEPALSQNDSFRGSVNQPVGMAPVIHNPVLFINDYNKTVVRM